MPIKQTIFVLLVEVFILYWWLCLAYARRKSAQAKAAEKAKYAIWDAAYSQALKTDKGQHYAITQAIRTVRAGPQAWNDAYDKAVKAGVRKYSAEVKAAAAARKAAHQ